MCTELARKPRLLRGAASSTALCLLAALRSCSRCADRSFASPPCADSLSFSRARFSQGDGGTGRDFFRGLFRSAIVARPGNEGAPGGRETRRIQRSGRGTWFLLSRPAATIHSRLAWALRRHSRVAAQRPSSGRYEPLSLTSGSSASPLLLVDPSDLTSAGPGSLATTPLPPSLPVSLSHCESSVRGGGVNATTPYIATVRSKQGKRGERGELRPQDMRDEHE